MRGDATKTEYPDNSFDLVFSNSVIEHVGSVENQEGFAREVRRLAPSYYIQTPSIRFPIEAHTGLPFWWYYPESFRNKLIDGWLRTRPVYGEFVKGTRVIREATLRRLFPDGQIQQEKVAGFVKSNIVWRRPEHGN